MGDSVRTWEMANKELRDKSEAAIVGEKPAMEQLSAMTNTLETMKEELSDKTEQLQLAESRLAGRGLGRQGSLMEGQGESRGSRLRDVELLMAQTKQELKSVNTQLVEAKRRADEYKGISEAAEARMVESSATMQELQGQLEGKVKQAEAEKELAEKKAGENSSLHKQLERVSQQMTDMTAAGLNTSGSADTSPNTSLQGNTSINEEEANTTQLMAIIKYLRQEKEILSGRLEVLQAETARTQSQLEHQIKIATDNQATLDRERQVQSQSVMS